MKKNYLIAALIGALLSTLLTHCGVDDSRAGGDYAQTITGPGGVQCFGIYNGNGTLVGGNCK